jgi:hypothetical protein
LFTRTNQFGEEVRLRGKEELVIRYGPGRELGAELGGRQAVFFISPMSPKENKRESRASERGYSDEPHAQRRRDSNDRHEPILPETKRFNSIERHFAWTDPNAKEIFPLHSIIFEGFRPNAI